MSKFHHGVATCNGRKLNFSLSFSLNFLCISQVPLGLALWSGYYQYYGKNLFHLQKLSKDDANFGQKWWRQKWKAKARHGLYGSQYFFSVMIWSLCWTLCFKHSIDVRHWILLVSPGKSLLPHTSPKFPQFISPLSLQSSPTSWMGHVRYINIITWLRGFQVKRLYLVLFLLYLSLLWELRDKRNLKNLQFWPESLGAMLEYWYIERGLLTMANLILGS